MKMFAYALFGVAILVISFFVLSPDLKPPEIAQDVTMQDGTETPVAQEATVPTTAEDEKVDSVPASENPLIQRPFHDAKRDQGFTNERDVFGSQSSENESFFLETSDDNPFGEWEADEFPPLELQEGDPSSDFADLPTDDLGFGPDDGFGNNEGLTSEGGFEPLENRKKKANPLNP